MSLRVNASRLRAIVPVIKVTGYQSTSTWTLDTRGLPSITAYEWQADGVATGDATSAVPTLSNHVMKQLSCVITYGGGLTIETPPQKVYMSHADASHNMMDNAALSLVPHEKCNFIARQSGAWSNVATWHGGAVPTEGANVLITNGTHVVYDVASSSPRLNLIRVDGKLSAAQDQNVDMLFHTMVIGQDGEFEDGTSSARLSDSYDHSYTISGREFRRDSSTDSNLDLRYDPMLMGRGILNLGTWRMWGAEKVQWQRALPIDASATELIMLEAPTGWSVGDTIAIGSTLFTSWTEGNLPPSQTEERVIAEIDGNIVRWSTPLTYPHKNQLAGSTRTDLYPVVALVAGNNITIQSEVTNDDHRRGHTMSMHGMSETDLWNVNFLNLGRTAKIEGDGGGSIINGKFRFYDPNGVNKITERVPLDDDNLLSRYPVHMHFVGFGKSTRDVVVDCFVQGSPGWGVVHHACDVDFFGIVMMDVFGAGMAAESGNEIGAWADCLVLRTGFDDTSKPTGNPKLREGGRAQKGDAGRFGYGFFFKSRGVRTVRCVACDVLWPYVFHHRNDKEFDSRGNVNAIVEVINHDTVNLDVKGLQQPEKIGTTVGFHQLPYEDLPIQHFSDNEAIGCWQGWFVTKTGPQQNHDAGIRLRWYKSWGHANTAADPEYVGSYVFEFWDIVSGNGVGSGMSMGQNMFQIVQRNCRVEGHKTAYFYAANETDNVGDPGVSNDASARYSVENPRLALLGSEAKDCTTFVDDDMFAGGGLVLADLFLRDDDYDNTLLDINQDPDWTFPLEAGSWDGTNRGNLVTQVTDSDGKKVDNISSTARMAPSKELIGDMIFGRFNNKLRGWKREKGWYDYLGDETLVIPVMISDRATWRPAIKSTTYRNVGAPLDPENGPGLLGTFTYAATPLSASNIITSVAENGSIPIDIVTDASPSGAGGAGTYVIHDQHYNKPDHGVVDIDYGRGVVTYTPDRNYVGPDEFHVFLESQGRYATIRVNVLVGPGGAPATPVVDTHFAVTDGGSQSIDVELFDRPSCGHRRIERVMYSTDGGSTWRRLCNFWVKDTHKITVESDGVTNFVSGNSYDLRIRYDTDHEFGPSNASADDPVTVA